MACILPIESTNMNSRTSEVVIIMFKCWICTSDLLMLWAFFAGGISTLYSCVHIQCMLYSCAHMQCMASCCWSWTTDVYDWNGYYCTTFAFHLVEDICVCSKDVELGWVCTAFAFHLVKNICVCSKVIELGSVLHSICFSACGQENICMCFHVYICNNWTVQYL